MNIYYFLAIICTIVTMVLTLNQKEKKIMQTITIVFTVVTMVFTYLAAKQDGQETEDNLSQTITEQSSEIKRLSSQNIELSNIIFKNTQQITGNGSYPIVNIGGGQDNGNKTQIIVGLIGEFALPNVTARIVVIPDYSNVSGLDLRVLGIGNETINIGTLRKSEFKSFLIETKTKETAVTIFFNSDNNSWTETIRIYKTKNSRKTMFYIQDSKGNYLQKKVDPNFPTNENGEIVIWNNTSIKINEL